MLKLDGESILSQDVLRKLEALCTQDESPACQAACPLHLDVRSFNAHIAQDDLKGAYKLYAKAIPFTSIIAHTCDAPCKLKCKRKEFGGSIEIRKLEQTVASALGKPSEPPLLFPKKEGRVAVIGGGLCGMTAALDLCKKGYKVTLFEKEVQLGGRLRNMPDLPESVLDAEIDAFFKFPIEFKPGTEAEIGSLEQAAGFLEAQNFDAAYISCKSDIDSDPETLKTTNEKIVAGSRGGRLTDGESTIYDLYDGRSAAITIDRIMQGVSVMAGREKEGSGETQLFTVLDEVRPAAPDGTEVYDEGLAVSEAARCIQCNCLECVKKCGFMQHYDTYPRKMVREVYNNLSIAMGTRYANDMIDSCALCGQCGAICPNGLDMAEVFRVARERMTDTEKMPPSAFEFALLDMKFSLSEHFFMCQHEPGTDRSKYLFFPGCQLAASEPELTMAAYEDLKKRLKGGTGLFLGCCGVMAKWAGEKDLFESAKEQLLSAWEEAGKPVVIAGCPTCAATLMEMGMDVVSIYEILSGPDMEPSFSEGGEKSKSGKNDGIKLVLHHACGARHNKAVKDSVFGLAKRLDLELLETDMQDTQSPCCGYGGLVSFSNEEVAEKITQVAVTQLSGTSSEGTRMRNLSDLAEQDHGRTTEQELDIMIGQVDKESIKHRRDNADMHIPILTYCVNCRDRFINEGKESHHLLELIYENVKANHAWPTWSRRHDNRRALKRRFLNEIRGEETPDEARLVLFMDDEVSAKLERVHILEDDLRDLIDAAEKSRRKFLEPETGHFIACMRPANVTIWAEYASEDDGFRIFNAYSHRMSVALTNKLDLEGTHRADENFSQKPQKYDAEVEGWEGIVCMKCDEPLSILPVTLSYLNAAFQSNLPACPKCGMIYIPEELAAGKMLRVEKALEDK